MCGRYYRRSDKQRIAEAFELGKLPDDFVLPPDFNVAPSTFQPVIRANRETGDRELEMMRWNLLPYFAKSPADFKGFSTISAKAETVATAPTWRRPFERRRCLVPADGFYEWKNIGFKKKQPYSGYVPGHFSSSSDTSVNCNGGSTNVNCSATTTTNGTGTAPREISYSVTGATLSLLLPDGRIAVVNCVSKYSPKGDYVNRRSCRMPLVNDIQAEFKGKNVKLIWTASIDGKKTDSETYKILGVLDK
jgi:hypothetical protein